jgi:hypothetical protein
MQRLAAVILAAATVAPAAPAAPMTHRATFTSRNPQLVGLDFDLEILADGPIEDARTRVRLVLTDHPRKPNAPPGSTETDTERSQADSPRCPQIRKQIADLRVAEAAQVTTAFQGAADRTIVSIDAPLLGGRASDRMVVKDTGFLSPIELWLGETVTALGDCWKPAP